MELQGCVKLSQLCSLLETENAGNLFAGALPMAAQ
jgi:hypothetical protein